MPSAADRIDLGPPRDAGGIRSFGVALLIHALLIAALTWGVNWKRSDSAATFAAELWSSPPADAVPMASVAPPPVPPQVAKAAPESRPTPESKPAPSDPDIALAQEKKRNRLKEEQAAQEKTDREQAKLKQAKVQAQAQRQAQAQEQAEQDKASRQLQQQKQKQALQAADKQRDKQRDEQLKRMQQQVASASPTGAAADGSPGGTSRASAGGKGSSKTYGAIARAAIVPNVVFTEAFDGNPLTKVEVRLALDGTIISAKLVQPSGNKNWDNAVYNAVIRTRVMPKDVDGKLPDTILILEFKPRFND